MNITIRSYQDKDLNTIKELFYNTIHQINAADYTPEELIVWAPELDNKQIDWEVRVTVNNSFVALVNHEIAGFSTINDNGYLDFLYVHHNYQRLGIASYLYTRMELEAEEEEIKQITTHASITAKPFLRKWALTVGVKILLKEAVKGLRII